MLSLGRRQEWDSDCLGILGLGKKWGTRDLNPRVWVNPPSASPSLKKEDQLPQCQEVSSWSDLCQPGAESWRRSALAVACETGSAVSSNLVS